MALAWSSWPSSGVDDYYLLLRQREEFGRLFVTIGVCVGIIASIVQILPSGDLEGQQATTNQPPTLAAMEGQFHSESSADAEGLGRPLAQRAPALVLCHADVHTGNVLLDAGGQLWIVDWDETLLCRGNTLPS